MNGDCNACYCVDEPDCMAEFYRADMRTARKEAKCSECEGVIRVGEKYENVAGRWDGEFSTFRTCAACVEIRGAFSCDGMYIHGTLWDDITEGMFGNFSMGCLDRLTSAAAKQKLIDQYKGYKDL